MPQRSPSNRHKRPSLSFVLLSTLMVALCLTGGASRPDVLGQAAARTAAATALLVAILFAERPSEKLPRAVLYLFLAIVVLPALQLVPLPADLWQALPGRQTLQQAVTGQQPWRPIAIEPGATRNALESLLVPAAVLAIAVGVGRAEWERVLVVLLGIIGVSALLGLVQVSGNSLANPLVNYTAGTVTGLFANRNHFALFLALGCLLTPVWAARNRDQISWRMPTALGLMLFFFMLILASGSRAGIFTGLVGSAAGLIISRDELRRAFRWMPRGVAPVAIAVGIIFVAGAVWLSIRSDRAASIERVVALSSSEDMRVRGFPVVREMVSSYFPWGTGFGSFDTMFRMHEPFGLLKPTYFNHAHNDFIEVLLDGGAGALLILLAALGWWLVASYRAWRGSGGANATPARVGSAMLLLILVASIFDYPVRTPMMMAMVSLAAVWLARGAAPQAALPSESRHL